MFDFSSHWDFFAEDVLRARLVKEVCLPQLRFANRTWQYELLRECNIQTRIATIDFEQQQKKLAGFVRIESIAYHLWPHIILFRSFIVGLRYASFLHIWHWSSESLITEVIWSVRLWIFFKELNKQRTHKCHDCSQRQHQTKRVRGSEVAVSLVGSARVTSNCRSVSRQCSTTSSWRRLWGSVRRRRTVIVIAIDGSLYSNCSLRFSFLKKTNNFIPTAVIAISAQTPATTENQYDRRIDSVVLH